MKGIVKHTLEESEALNLELFIFYKDKFINIGNSNKWCEIIKAIDEDIYFVEIDSRLNGFDFTNYEIVEILPTDAKWFNQDVEL